MLRVAYEIHVQKLHLHQRSQTIASPATLPVES